MSSATSAHLVNLYLSYLRRSASAASSAAGVLPQLAAAHHMASQTLHRLFEHEPFTVTDYIRAHASMRSTAT